MGLLGQQGDVVLVPPQGIPGDLPDCLSHIRFLVTDTGEFRAILNAADSVGLIPWGWDADAGRLARKILPAASTAPDRNSVYTVNSRSFSAQFDLIDAESRLTVFGRHFGCLCTTRDELDAGIEHLCNLSLPRWVAKPALSSAGRNRLIAEGRILNPQQTNWLRRQFHTAGCVYLEPWIPPARECGLQFEISPARNDMDTVTEVRLVGKTELISDPAGRYRGSVITPEPDPIWQPAAEHGLLVCQSAARLGYFGPLGIDCMEIRLRDSRAGIRMCSDINGRLTMGRLALALTDRTGQERWGVLLQTRNGNRSDKAASHTTIPFTESDCVVHRFRVSPETVAAKPVRTRLDLIVLDDRASVDFLINRHRRADAVQN